MSYVVRQKQDNVRRSVLISGFYIIVPEVKTNKFEFAMRMCQNILKFTGVNLVRRGN